MKRIRIFGCKTNRPLKDELRGATEYYRDWLMPLKRKLDLTISFVPYLLKDAGVFGECWDNDYHAFHIRIDSKLSKNLKFLTLAHEMVHVKQFALGELKFGDGCDKWYGKKYSINTPYHKQPWEKEAEGLESILHLSWRKNKH